MSSESEEEEYVVEAIRGWRHNLREGEREYFIKWQNYDEKENTWEPESNLHCPAILETFKKSLPRKEKKYFEAENAGMLSGFQRRAEFLGCIGTDGPHESDDEESSKDDKQSFYCLILFGDSDIAEEMTLKEFYRHEPVEAIKFCENRLLCRSS